MHRPAKQKTIGEKNLSKCSMVEAEKRSLKYAAVCFAERQGMRFHVHEGREKGKIDNLSCCWHFHPFWVCQLKDVALTLITEK